MAFCSQSCHEMKAKKKVNTRTQKALLSTLSSNACAFTTYVYSTGRKRTHTQSTVRVRSHAT